MENKITSSRLPTALRLGNTVTPDKSTIIVDLSVVTLFPSLIAVGSWEELFGVCAAGGKFMFEKASLCFPNCLCILVPNFPTKLHIAGAI